MDRMLLPHEVFKPMDAAEYARIIAAKGDLDTNAAKREGMIGAYGATSEADAYKKQYDAQIAAAGTEAKLKSLDIENKQGQNETAKTEGKIKQLDLARKQTVALGESANGLKNLWAQSKGNVELFNQAYAGERQKLIGLGIDEKSLPPTIPPDKIQVTLDTAITSASDLQKQIDHHYALELEKVKEKNKGKNDELDKANKIKDHVKKTLETDGEYRNLVSNRESLQKQVQTALRPEDQQNAKAQLQIIETKITQKTQKATADAEAQFGNGPKPTTDQGAKSFTEGQTATNPQTGAKLVYKGGQWVAAQ